MAAKCDLLVNFSGSNVSRNSLHITSSRWCAPSIMRMQQPANRLLFPKVSLVFGVKYMG